MIWNSANALHALIAMGQPAGNGQQGPPMWTNLPFLALMLIAFYVAILRPQQKRQKALTELMKSIKAGDKVVTTSGIIGIVVTVKDKSVSIRSAETKLEVLKSAISEITERESEPSQSAS
jgi:preprotein translocase subunit YajC